MAPWRPRRPRRHRARGVERFIAERSGRMDRPDRPGRAGRGAASTGSTAEVLDLGEGYRAAAADLARARQRWPGDPVVGELEALVGRARAMVYRTPGRRGSFGHWLTTGLFVRIRERPRMLLAAFVLLWGPSLGFAVWADHDPATARQVAQVSPLPGEASDRTGGGRAGSLSQSDRAALATTIFTNNIRVALIGLAVGLTGGLATGALLLYNGATVGLVVGLLASAGAGPRR